MLVISSGLLTMRALEIAKDLVADNIGVAVLHCHTIKPLDETAIASPLQRLSDACSGRPLRHSVIGGLGEAVVSALLQHRVQPARF